AAAVSARQHSRKAAHTVDRPIQYAAARIRQRRCGVDRGSSLVVEGHPQRREDRQEQCADEAPVDDTDLRCDEVDEYLLEVAHGIAALPEPDLDRELLPARRVD